jgi:hypothetical protein
MGINVQVVHPSDSPCVPCAVTLTAREDRQSKPPTLLSGPAFVLVVTPLPLLLKSFCSRRKIITNWGPIRRHAAVFPYRGCMTSLFACVYHLTCM